ncbi:MAG: SRPBCC domain-containing protein, partial [Myxococcota bacterium]
VTFVFDHGTLAAGAGEIPSKYAQFSGETRYPVDVVELDPPHRMVFHWHEEQDSHTRVVIELEAQGDQTLLTLTHYDLEGPNRRSAASGWHVHLSILGEILAGEPSTVFWPAPAARVP